MTSFNLSELFERVAARVPTREAIVAAERRLDYAALDARASRLANALAARGIGARDHVGLVLANGSEYVESMIAAYKLRAVPVNVNHRYVPAELRALFEDADLRGVIVHRAFAPRALEARVGLPLLRQVLVVDDGTVSRCPVRSTTTSARSPMRASSAISRAAARTTSTWSTPAARPAGPRE